MAPPKHEDSATCAFLQSVALPGSAADLVLCVGLVGVVKVIRVASLGMPEQSRSHCWLIRKKVRVKRGMHV